MYVAYQREREQTRVPEVSQKWMQFQGCTGCSASRLEPRLDRDLPPWITRGVSHKSGSNIVFLPLSPFSYLPMSLPPLLHSVPHFLPACLSRAVYTGQHQATSVSTHRFSMFVDRGGCRRLPFFFQNARVTAGEARSLGEDVVRTIRKIIPSPFPRYVTLTRAFNRNANAMPRLPPSVSRV